MDHPFSYPFFNIKSHTSLLQKIQTIQSKVKLQNIKLSQLP